MGDIADAIIEGELCQECGVYMGEAVGYPVSCRDCAPRKVKGPAQPPKTTCKCPTCGKKVKIVGLANHIKDAHP